MGSPARPSTPVLSLTARKETSIVGGSEFQVLLSCRALDEGIDVKEVGVGIQITNGKCKRQFIQRIGKIIRPMGRKNAKFCVVYSPDTTEETYFKTIPKILLSSLARVTRGQGLEGQSIKSQSDFVSASIACFFFLNENKKLDYLVYGMKWVADTVNRFAK
jgi:hypothetical protein